MEAGTYDRKKGKTGLVLYEGKGLPRLPGKRPNPRALAVRYRPICGAMINLQKLHQGKLSLRKAQNTKEMLGKVAILSKELTSIVKTLTYDGSGKTNLIFDLIKRSPNVYTHLHLIVRNPDQPLYQYLKDKLEGFCTIYGVSQVSIKPKRTDCNW
ncbi:uncharacterized protein PHALS_00363 [Plasmopara halstedii]|uniref:Uncharacterized protein n=1 Tax=Plasmopara halstedii TaxID=4781 RepID=A0A0P1A7Q2_PLAHL|nr:uncharacterized protein PHALS_00363 [Plasmopara halstedii]CEG36042.1 hypothetical protein PHALS_00363 [Plasmopara halstedii]|eukprot:XP_024572411.1 hypothetical protein PHALS_00363 [Plasmopara halstedii]